MLLVYDRDFTYGQGFYLVLTVEAKERLLKVRSLHNDLKPKPCRICMIQFEHCYLPALS